MESKQERESALLAIAAHASGSRASLRVTPQGRQQAKVGYLRRWVESDGLEVALWWCLNALVKQEMICLSDPRCRSEEAQQAVRQRIDDLTSAMSSLSRLSERSHQPVGSGRPLADEVAEQLERPPPPPSPCQPEPAPHAVPVVGHIARDRHGLPYPVTVSGAQRYLADVVWEHLGCRLRLDFEGGMVAAAVMPHMDPVNSLVRVVTNDLVGALESLVEALIEAHPALPSLERVQAFLGGVDDPYVPDQSRRLALLRWQTPEQGGQTAAAVAQTAGTGGDHGAGLFRR